MLWVDITPPPIKTKLKYVKNTHIFKTTTLKKTVHNLITFSIVFTNTNQEGGLIQPPPPSKLGVLSTPSKLRLKKTNGFLE